MDAAISIAAIIFLYVIGIYNRMQTLRQAVEETKANIGVEGGVGTSTGSEQDLLRLGRCNAAIAAYNTYRSQFPQIMLSRLAGFQPLEFSAAGRAVAPKPSAEIIQLDIPGPRKVRDPGAQP